jgi:signal transduction histidine kinase
MVAKSDFLATVSHEIRTPLTAVLGFAELLLRSPELPASTRSYVERMQQGGETLRTVLDSVLDYSKIQAGQIELEPKSTHLRELLASTVGLFAPLARAKDLALALQVAEDAPDRVLVDRGRFAQALGVLLDNAVKFTQEGSVTVEAAFHPGAQMLELSVTDTGIGIDPATQETLFTAFTQGESTNARRYGGVGLGLAVSRGLARLMALKGQGRGSACAFTPRGRART